MVELPSVDVVRRCTDQDFDPRTPVMVLRWHGTTQRLWELPEGLCVTGDAPTRLGLCIRRVERDSFSVRLLWDRTLMTWPALSRVELLGSCLSPLLGALGLDLWSMLDQPMATPRLRAA